MLYNRHGVTYLEEPKLVRGLVRPHDQGLDIANIDISACDGDGCRWR
jgi:hypothetical protein